MVNSLTENNAAGYAAKFINQTNKPVFLTGKAGTGKTTFLRNIIEHTHKNAIIVAPTGIAAINAGGVTIHSQFGIPFGLFVPDSSYKVDSATVKVNTPYTMVKHLNMREARRRVLQELELLIIDEVSMLRADLLDTIDFVLRNIRRQSHKAFGGVQVLFIGDLMQLPPVVKDEEWNILSKYYQSIYFFDAQVLKQEPPVYIELDKIYRQSDPQFIDLLNNLRNNRVSRADIDLLNTFYKPELAGQNLLNTITLTTHNYKADEINRTALEKLSGKVFTYSAEVKGEFPENAFPVDYTLELKVGAQIMFIKNDISGRQQYFNGKLAVVIELEEDRIVVDCMDGSKPLKLEKYQWRNVAYEMNEITREIDEKDIGEFLHYPVKLAWAITVHKSQGLTFEKAILDVNKAFAPGQVYVALSRLKSLDGLILTSPIQINSIAQDQVLVQYSENKPDTDALNSLISKETIAFLKNYLLRVYDFAWLYTNIKQHAASYVSGEKSNKQKYETWAADLLQTFEPLKLHADKFCNQLNQIFMQESDGYLNTVESRNNAASNYFLPLLKGLSKSILTHIETIKDEKQVKTYLEELLELEGLVYKHIQLLQKSTLLIDHFMNNKPFHKDQFKAMEGQSERIEILRQGMMMKEVAKKEEKKERKSKASGTKKSKAKKEKVAKPDSKSLSYELFKLGKTIPEIAAERSMALSTVEGHLAHYVSLGMIPVTDFMSEEKFKKIMDVYKSSEETGLSALKEKLGETFSYSEIRFAVATQKYI